MPSIDRPLSGRALHFRLDDEQRAELLDRNLLAKSGRSARTLVKEGPLRVTLVGLAPGGTLAEHHAEGPITVHLLSGEVRFRAGQDEWTLTAGDLLAIGAGIPHAVESENGGEFLLTVSVSSTT